LAVGVSDAIAFARGGKRERQSPRGHYYVGEKLGRGGGGGVVGG